jgi:hypothetical protein
MEYWDNGTMIRMGKNSFGTRVTLELHPIQSVLQQKPLTCSVYSVTSLVHGGEFFQNFITLLDGFIESLFRGLLA